MSPKTMSATTMSADLRVVPLAPFGARLENLPPAAAWDAATAAAVERAFLDHPVLVFPGRPLEPAGVLALARRFGEPVAQVNREKRLDGLPEVTRIDSTVLAREPGQAARFPVQSSARAEEWHTDQSFVACPAKATVLHALAVPARGGATWFCDTAAAYDALPEERRRRLAGLRAVHAYEARGARHRATPRTAEEMAESPDVVHPLVRTHPDSGRKALFLNINRLDRIEDLPPAESAALLDELAAWAAQDRFVYRHRWSVGDTVVWDNRCTMHRVEYDAPVGEPRLMLRAVTRGDRPF